MFCSEISFGLSDSGNFPNKPTLWFGTLLDIIILVVSVKLIETSGLNGKDSLQSPLSRDRTWSDSHVSSSCDWTAVVCKDVSSSSAEQLYINLEKNIW